MGNIRRENLIKLIAFIGILSFLVVVLLRVHDMLVTQVLAFVIFYSLNPIVNRMERAGSSRILAITSLFVVTGLFLWLVIFLLSPMVSSQIKTLSTEYGSYIDILSKQLSRIDDKVKELTQGSFEMNASEKIAQYLSDGAKFFFTALPNFASSIFTTLLLAPFFAFFMLKDGRHFVRKLLALVPNNIFELSLNLLHQLNTQLGDFIRARFLEALIVGAIVWLGLEIKDVKYAVILGVFAGITNLIPYIGPVIGAAPAFLVAFFTDHTNSFLFVYITVVYVFAQIVDMLFIVPLLVAKIVDLHPISVVVSIIIGSQLMGVLGMIIAIPVASALKVISQAIFTHLIEFKS